MFKSKLFDVLCTLDENEYRRFGEFVASPFFNKSRVLIKLHSVYGKFHPIFKGENFTKEDIFKKLQPGKRYNEAVLRNYNSDMLALAEKFLSQLNINRSSQNHYKHLLNELNIRNIHSLFESNYKAALAELESSPRRDTSYHYDRHFIKQEKDLYNGFMRSFSAEDKRESEVSFINFFLSVLLEMYAYIINQRDVLRIKYDITLFDELVGIVEAKSGMLAPVVLMHFNRLMLHSTRDEKYYLLLKQQVEKHGSMMETVNHFDAYICLINYVRWHKDMDLAETTRELFELRKNIIEKNIFIGKNHISLNMFLNQVRSGLRLGEFEWVYRFIETYKERLLETERHNTYHFSLGLYYYETGKYNEALKNLLLITGGSINMLEIKNLTARIHWQQNNFDMIPSALSAYKQYIAKNRKLEKSIVEVHSGFIAVMEKLFRYKYDGKKINLAELKKEAEDSAIVYKNWVIEAIDNARGF